jgi:ribonuclease D
MHTSQRLLSLPEKIPVTYIRTNDELKVCIAHLAQAPVVAFDLEFDREHFTYGFTLCLMQIASATHCYLIDPFSGLDISLSFPLFENPAIQKITHSSAEDLKLLHSLKCYPKNLVDTELYAKLLNYERTSLGAMVQALFGLALDKKLQKVNWVLRPLGAEQLTYAANDVLYLLQMKTELDRQAAAKDLLPFLQQENELLSTTIHHFKTRDNFLKTDDFIHLSPHNQYILNGILIYRDAIAKQQNRPAHYIMNEDTTRNLVANNITAADWIKVKGLHPAIKSTEARDQLFEHIQKLTTEAGIKKLSTQKSRRSKGQDDFYAEKTRKDLLKATIFTPIQNEIAANFGEHAMRYIFNNAAVDAILQGQVKIGEMKNMYRKELVQNAADKLGIAITEFE